MIQKFAFDLLKEWCDKLVELQITQIKDPNIYGGIMCPSCARIHGRCGDAIYPMMYMADKTGDKKYLDCAILLFDWSERMVRPEDCYNNDTNHEWSGITVFAQIQLGEALLYHGHLLERSIIARWRERFERSSEYLYTHIDEIGGNVNYPISSSASMAIAYKLTKDEKYAKLAKELALNALGYLTDEGLIYGEGHPFEAITPKGCRPVDIGYNVEESLPNLVLYAILMDDKEVLEQVIKSMEAHLSFMLPDGAWDNSWGTRNNKWSYWGSRTSDGCQGAYGILAEKSPEFAAAALKNMQLLRKCTKDGLLYGGTMLDTAEEPPCVHHTFCHAKALAAFLEHDIKESVIVGNLPRQEAHGIQYFPTVHIRLAANYGWRATISDYDYEYSPEGHATGGALTMLWNEKIGPVMAASMGEYSLIEPNNMQLPGHFENICSTARLEYWDHDRKYRSINDLCAEVREIEEETASLLIKGKMCDADNNADVPFEIVYCAEESFIINGKCNGKNCRYYFPIIARSTDKVCQMDDYTYSVIRENVCMTIHCNVKIEVNNQYPKKRRLGEKTTEEYIHRMFNPVSGFEFIPFYLNLEKDHLFNIEICIEK